MKTYEVTVTFRAIVEDDGRYPDAKAVRDAIYEGIGIPGYMRVGMDVLATGASAVRKMANNS